jgi:hypothetical protein
MLSRSSDCAPQFTRALHGRCTANTLADQQDLPSDGHEPGVLGEEELRPRISFRLFREILLRPGKLSSNSSFSAALSKPSKGILIGSGRRQPAVQA